MANTTLTESHTSAGSKVQVAAGTSRGFLARSSVGAKYVMAVTGLGLILFVIAHMAGNLLIFAGKGPLNAYAHALENNPALLWSARIGLLVIFVLHILLGLRLTW